MNGGLGDDYQWFRILALGLIDKIEAEEDMGTSDSLLARQKQLGDELTLLGYAVSREMDHPRVLLHDLAALNAKLEDVLAARLGESSTEKRP